MSGINIVEGESYIIFYFLNNLKTTFAIILLSFFLLYFERIKISQLREKELKIEFLQKQVSPHFLLNSINNIVSTSITDPGNVKEELIDLSEWIRYSLYKMDKTIIPIQDEIELIDIYIKRIKLNLQNKDKLQSNFKISDLSKIEIPPLLLYNYIENAFKYSGILNHNKNAYINIQLIVDQRRCFLKVENSLAIESLKIGIGMQNNKERLESFFKEKYKLDVQRSKNEFVVQLEIII